MGDLCTDGYSSLDCLLNFLAQVCKLSRRLIRLGIRHTTGSGVQSRNLEQSMRLLNILDLHYWIQMHLGNGFRDSDDGLKLTDSDWNTIRLLCDSLGFGHGSVGNVHILEHMASFLRKLWLALALGIAHVLSEHFERDLTLLLLLVVLHVQP